MVISTSCITYKLKSPPHSLWYNLFSKFCCVEKTCGCPQGLEIDTFVLRAKPVIDKTEDIIIIEANNMRNFLKTSLFLPSCGC